MYASNVDRCSRFKHDATPIPPESTAYQQYLHHAPLNQRAFCEALGKLVLSVTIDKIVTETGELVTATVNLINACSSLEVLELRTIGNRFARPKAATKKSKGANRRAQPQLASLNLQVSILVHVCIDFEHSPSVSLRHRPESRLISRTGQSVHARSSFLELLEYPGDRVNQRLFGDPVIGRRSSTNRQTAGHRQHAGHLVIDRRLPAKHY